MTKIKFYYVYVLELNNKSLYIGYTTDVKRRFKEHQKGYSKYTKSKRPLKLIYFEAYLNIRDAKKREEFLKGGSGRKYLKMQLRNYFE